MPSNDSIVACIIRFTSLKDQPIVNTPTPHAQGAQSIFSEISLGGGSPSKNNLTNLTQKDAEKPASQRIPTEDSHEQFEDKTLGGLRPVYSVSGSAGKNTLGSADPLTFIREIELGSHFSFNFSFYSCFKELKNASSDPSSLDEAKQVLALKTAIIIKMKSYISNFSHASATNLGGIQEIHQNLIEYLKCENDRLENKNLVLQSELGVEKTRSEQIKEVN